MASQAEACVKLVIFLLLSVAAVGVIDWSPVVRTGFILRGLWQADLSAAYVLHEAEKGPFRIMIRKTARLTVVAMRC